MLKQAAAVAALSGRILSNFIAFSSPTDEAYHKLFTPNAKLIGGFVVGSVILNIQGLFQLCQMERQRARLLTEDLEDEMTKDLHPYSSSYLLPIYCAAHAILTLSTVASYWNQEVIAQIFALLGIGMQLYSLCILTQNPRESVITPHNIFSHLCFKTDMAFTLLLLFQTQSSTGPMTDPMVVTLAFVVLVFVSMSLAAGPDPTLGLWAMYILVALLTGEPLQGRWKMTFLASLGLTALALASELTVSIYRGFPWLDGFRDDPTILRLPENAEEPCPEYSV